MRKRQLPIALFIASTSTYASVTLANEPWKGSYSAGGQCFCSGELASAIASTIVPTPIGGQTVQQVCERLGGGPGLVRSDGIFNHTVYRDPQCGHGPHADTRAPRDADCVGTVDGIYASCEAAGPRWALSQAYNAPGAPAAAKPDITTATLVAQTSDTIEVASGKKAEDSTKSALSLQKTLSDFKGKTVNIANDRYYQARAGLPAEGGASGSRIILDGVVFLRDDENLSASDLFTPVQTPKKISTRKAMAAVAEKSAKQLAAANKRKTPRKRSAASIKAARLKEEERLLAEQKFRTKQAFVRRQQKEREARALAEYEADQQARKARLAQKKALIKQQDDIEQKNLAQQYKLAQQLKLAQQQQAQQQQAQQQQAQQQQAQQQLAQQQLAQQQLAQQQLAQQQLAQQQKLVQQRKAQEELAVADAASRKGEPSLGAALPTTESRVASALRLPIEARASSRDFAYVEAMPASYDIGGHGLIVEASATSNMRFQYLGRLGVADTYREFMVGGGYYVTPDSATRMTVVLLAGIEHGSFELRDEERAPGLTVTSADSGLYLGAMSRFVVSSKFELKGGVGYSSYFEGDATVFGGGYYHVTPRLDIMSRFELGDNDNLGIGIRYYY